MAFKSEAQRKKFLELVKDGKMSKSVFDKWESNTPNDLPDRVEKFSKKKEVTNKIKKIKRI